MKFSFLRMLMIAAVGLLWAAPAGSGNKRDPTGRLESVKKRRSRRRVWPTDIRICRVIGRTRRRPRLKSCAAPMARR